MVAINWYLVKYVPDPFRNEPKNIGVVVEAEGRGAVRLVGQKGDILDGRRVRGIVRSSRTLRAWLEYLEYHLESGSFREQLERLSGRSGQNYLIEPRGVLLNAPDATIKEIAEGLFQELVGESTSSDEPSIDEIANTLLYRRLKVPQGHRIERNVVYTVELNGEPHDVGFDYRYENGRTTLLDKITLSPQDRIIRQKVHDLLFRIEHVREDLKVKQPNFVTLYDLGKTRESGPVDSYLRAIERFSHTVNVRDRRAAENVADALGVPVLQSA